MMKRLLAAGALALSAALLTLPTAAFANAANDEVTGATPVGPVPYSASIDFTGATSNGSDPGCTSGNLSLWYKVTPTNSGWIDVRLAGSTSTSWYAEVGVYSGSPDSLQEQACVYTNYYDQASGGSVARFNGTAGTAYYVLVAAEDYNLVSAKLALQLAYPSWGNWASVGGSLATFPDCEIDPNNNGEEECWARSSAPTMLWAHGDPDYFYMGRDQGGSLGGPPSCVSRTVRVDCFAASSTNHLIWNTYSGTGWKWNGWTDLGGNASGRPECIPVGSLGVDCYYGSADHALYRKSYNGYYWAATQKLGGSTVVRPECVVRSGTDCFIVNAKGALWTVHISTAGKAGKFVKLGTGFGLAPQCFNNGGKLDCFAQSKTHQLLKGYFNGSTWGAWTNLGGNVVSMPACYETSTGSNPNFDCFWQDGGFHLIERQRTAGTWGAEQNLGGAIQQMPSCVLQNGRKDCYARGTDNALWRRSYY